MITPIRLKTIFAGPFIVRSRSVGMRYYLCLCAILGISTAISAEAPAPDKASASIKITLEGEQKELIKEVDILIKSTQLECNSPRWKLKQALDDDIHSLQTALRAYGYYHARVERKVSEISQCWSVVLTLFEGPRMQVDQVDVRIEGDAFKDEGFMRSVLKNSLQKGDPLLHERYEGMKKRIQSTAARRGYFDGQFITSQLRVDPAKNIANIVLHYQSGVRYRVGELQIEQDALNDALFRKYLIVERGKPFNDAYLVSSYQGLSASGYFSSIDVAPLIDQRQEGEVPILVKAVRGKPKSYSVGIGASTDTGPRFKLAHSNKLFNNRGHSYRTELSLSPVISNLGFSYRIPDEKPQTDFIEFSSRAIHEDTDTSTSDTINVGMARSNLLNNDWTRIMGLLYSYDDFDVGEDNDTTLLLRPSLGFSKTVTDSPLRPTQGYRLNIEFTGATQALLSDIDFMQVQANAKLVQGLGEKFRFLGRLDLGYTETQEFNQLPSNLRFFAGGDNSVRGYDYESLGPEDDAGDVVGGEGLIVGSVEVDYLFRSDWSVALFVDSGNAFDTDQIDLKVGAGFGIRWQSPIGPIRVDLGFPVDEPDADDTWRLHFSLGPDL